MKKRQHNFRLDPVTDELLGRLAESMAMSETDVVIQAVRQLARRELPAEKKPGKKSRKQLDTV